MINIYITTKNKEIYNQSNIKGRQDILIKEIEVVEKMLKEVKGKINEYKR